MSFEMMKKWHSTHQQRSLQTVTHSAQNQDRDRERERERKEEEAIVTVAEESEKKKKNKTRRKATSFFSLFQLLMMMITARMIYKKNLSYEKKQARKCFLLCLILMERKVMLIFMEDDAGAFGRWSNSIINDMLTSTVQQGASVERLSSNREKIEEKGFLLIIGECAMNWERFSVHCSIDQSMQSSFNEKE